MILWCCDRIGLFLQYGQFFPAKHLFSRLPDDFSIKILPVPAVSRRRLTQDRLQTKEKEIVKMKRTLAIVLSLCLLVSAFSGLSLSVYAADNTPPSAPDGLLMQLSRTPLGIESDTPELCWVVNDPDQDEIQTAYQILVATSKEKLTEGQADIWNSGKVTSRENSNVPYAGPAIPADGIYYWTVRTYDKEGAASPYAEPQFFSTAVKDNWQASAIWSGETDDSASVSSIFEQAGLTNYIYEMDFTITDVALGFSFRKMTNNATEEKMYMWQIRAETATSPAILRPHIASGPNAFSTIGDVDLSKAGVSVKTGESHHLKISCIGSKIETYIDDILVASHTLTEYAAGTFGLRCGGSESGLVDNLKVSKPDGTVLYENDFDSGVNPFTGGGSIENSSLRVGKGSKIYYVLSSTMTALADYGMECDFTVDDVALGFSVRKQQNTSMENYCYMFQIRANSGSTPAQLKPHIIKSSTNEVSGKGSSVSLDTLGIDINPGERHHLKILAVGTKIEVWIDGILCLTMSDATEYPAGSFGIRCGNSESGTVDNLKITDTQGRTIYENDFESGENPFPNGGTAANGVLKINKGEKLYYVSETEGLPDKGNIIFLRDEITIQKPVKKALVSAIGKNRDKIKQYNFKLYVNGACVGLPAPSTTGFTPMSTAPLM